MNLPFATDPAGLKSDSGFLLLAWCELFGDYSPDNYQPRLYHTASLVEELAEVAQRATAADRWRPHVDRVRDELKVVVETEAAFLQTIPAYEWSLRQLLQVDGMRNIAVIARTLASNAPAYEQATVAALRKAAGDLPRAKEATLTALRRFATLIIQAGRTSGECLDLVTLELLTLPAAQVVETLIQFGLPRLRAYRCVLAISGQRRFAQQVLRKVGFSLVAQEEANLDEGIRDSGETVVVEIIQRAAMPQEAARQAIAVLRRATNVFNFYRNRPEIIQRAGCWVTDESGQRTRIDLDDRALERLHPRKNAAALTGEVLDRVQPERLGGRLINALEHCSLAQVSTIPRVQLVNLWSAVECLSGASHAQSILSQVTDVLLPTVVFQRCEKTLRYVAIQIAQLRKAQPERRLGEGFIHSQPIQGFVGVEELLLSLCRPEDHPHIVGLLEFAAPHPLLCNRLYDLWKLYHRPAALGEKLRSARKTVEWHIARIYRARNLMVHEGTEVDHIPWMLDHLHSYFTAVCGRVLEALRSNPSWGVEEALASWQLRCDYLLDSLEHFPARLTVADVIRQADKLQRATPWALAAPGAASAVDVPTRNQ